MKRLLLAPATLLLACASVATRAEFEAERLHEELRQRIALPETTHLDGAVDDVVREMARDGVDEEEAVRIALLHNRAVRAALEELRARSAEAVRAALPENPLLGVEARFLASGTELDFALLQPLVETLLLPFRARVAEAELEAARARITGELIGLVFDVRRALVDLAAARATAALARKVLSAAQASFDLAEMLHDAGNVSRAQLANERAVASRARVDLAAADADAVEAREVLNRLLGLWGEAAAWEIAARLEDEVADGLVLEHVESRSIARSLDLVERRAHIDALAQQAGMADWTPFAGGSEFGAVAMRESGGGWGVGPSFSIGLPLFDRGGATRYAADARLRGALDGYYARAVDVRSAARSFRDRVAALSERLRLLREVDLPARAEVLREALKNYNAMQIGAFDAILARQQEIEGEREHLTTLRDAWRARLDLEELLAGRLDVQRLERVATTPVTSRHDTAVREH